MSTHYTLLFYPVLNIHIVKAIEHSLPSLILRLKENSI